MLASTPVHPFRVYVHSLYLSSNEKLTDPRTGQFRKLPLHRRLLVCNIITGTSAAMCQPAYLVMRTYSHDIRFIPALTKENPIVSYTINNNNSRCRTTQIMV